MSVLPRRLVALAAAAVLVGCTGPADPPLDPSEPSGPDGGSTPDGRFERIACGLPPIHLERTRRGYVAGRSGEIQLVPEAPNVIGEWLSHSGPWGYVQRVPIFFYGPGHVPAAGQVGTAATAADIAPTLAAHLDFRFAAPDGRVLTEAVGEAPEPPRVVVAVVWDGAGRNVLGRYPDAWPELGAMIPEGAWFRRGTVGTSPTVTPAVHATLGTGALPMTHGVVDLTFRKDGEMISVDDERPGFLDIPTLADEWDRERGNRPVVAMVAAVGTMAMLGHGASVPGGDRDVLAQYAPRISGEDPWAIPDGLDDVFEFPEYVNDRPAYEAAIREVDLDDGALDGRWMGEAVLDTVEGVGLTPAFSTFQSHVIETVIDREGIGDDDVPDLLLLNFKQIDKVGHQWSMDSPQMEAVVRSTDRALAGLVETLDREVGEGRWVLALTADHGSTPSAERSGAYLIDLPELTRDLQDRFDLDDDDRPVIVKTRVTQMWVDEEELAEHGFTLEDVSAFVMRYTKEENAEGGTVEVPLRPGEAGETMYAAAFPGRLLEDLRCQGPGSG